MAPEINLLFIILIIFFASLIRSVFGFGDALFAMPLLVMFLSPLIATPVVAFIGLTISFLILLKHWQKINLKSLMVLILSTLAGIPIGLYFLKGASEDLVKIVLAVILILFSFFKLLKSYKLELKNDRFAFIFGFISGVFGGAYNTNGPPIIIYGTLRKWQPDKFRVILQGVFFPSNVLIIVGQGLAGLWTEKVILFYLYSLPIILIALFIGSRLNRRIPAEKFVKYAYILLMIIGVILLFTTIY
jgi:uncharacterized protein